MNILAIDPGGTSEHPTGWASWDGRAVESGVQEFSLKRGESPGMRFIRFRRWLREMLDILRPGLVVYEQAHHRGGAATQVLANLTGRIEEEVAALRAKGQQIEHAAVHSGTLKRWATGRGNADKAAMIRAANERSPEGYYPIASSDEADALLALLWARETYDAAGGE